MMLCQGDLCAARAAANLGCSLSQDCAASQPAHRTPQRVNGGGPRRLQVAGWAGQLRKNGSAKGSIQKAAGGDWSAVQALAASTAYDANSTASTGAERSQAQDRRRRGPACVPDSSTRAVRWQRSRAPAARRPAPAACLRRQLRPDFNPQATGRLRIVRQLRRHRGSRGRRVCSPAQGRLAVRLQ
jgi:hypothetical protein